MTRNKVIIPIALLVSLLYSCSGNVYHRLDESRIKVGKDIYILYEDNEDEEYMCLPELDSLSTDLVLNNEIATGILSPDKINGNVPLLYDTKDLRLLPYYLDSNLSNPYSEETYYSIWLFLNLCRTRSSDDRLFEICKKVAIRTASSHLKTMDLLKDDIIPKIEKKFVIESNSIGRNANSDNYIDSLRVMILGYNDREALDKLEKYYRDKGDDKGIAIYYKVMLGYEGNGDLSERFYRVLEPYFDETPEFRRAVREVLLRAAICDGNARAQALCDSLGFSLCDYRLPVPVEK